MKKGRWTATCPAKCRDCRHLVVGRKAGRGGGGYLAKLREALAELAGIAGYAIVDESEAESGFYRLAVVGVECSLLALEGGNGDIRQHGYVLALAPLLGFALLRENGVSGFDIGFFHF
jgi:hypothetical protein